jgi:spermidine synthase
MVSRPEPPVRPHGLSPGPGRGGGPDRVPDLRDLREPALVRCFEGYLIKKVLLCIQMNYKRENMGIDFHDEWFVDKENENKAVIHRIKCIVYKYNTKFQLVEIVDTYDLGRTLILDGQLQSAEIDEFIYHECLVHPCMIFSNNHNNILLLGGGEGATLRELLKYNDVKYITMVDIDEELINISKDYLIKWHCGSFDDKRVRLIFDDAVSFVQNSEEKYDLVIMDINDPDIAGPAANIYRKEFFLEIKNKLVKNGIFVTQAFPYYFDNPALHIEIYKALSSIFPYVESYYEYIPSFESIWSFICCRKQRKPFSLNISEINKKINDSISSFLRFYDGETHHRIFLLPKIIRDSLNNINGGLAK